MTPVAIVEDHTAVRETLARWVDSAPDFHCVRACATGKEALRDLPRDRPDIVLMDIQLPGESGITCTARLLEKLPGVQVIIITMYRDHDLIFQALQAGASGYLLKRSSQAEILRALAEVRAGGAPMSGEVARRIIEVFRQPHPLRAEPNRVSPREAEVLELLATGLSNKHIASRMGISYETVCVHLRRIYDKLHVHSRTEAILKYLGERDWRVLDPACARKVS